MIRNLMTCAVFILGNCMGQGDTSPNSGDVYARFVRYTQAMANTFPTETNLDAKSNAGAKKKVDLREEFFAPMAEVLCVQGTPSDRSETRRHLTSGNPEELRRVLEGPCRVQLRNVEMKNYQPDVYRGDDPSSSRWTQWGEVNTAFRLWNKTGKPRDFVLDTSVHRDAWNKGSMEDWLAEKIGTLSCGDLPNDRHSKEDRFAIQCGKTLDFGGREYGPRVAMIHNLLSSNRVNFFEFFYYKGLYGNKTSES